MASSRTPAAGERGLIKSKSRVRDLAEVYTAEREVNAMLDLVQDGMTAGLPRVAGTGKAALNMEKATFLEPACGNGNFLVEILRRKLQANKQTCESFTPSEAGRNPPAFKKGGKADEAMWAVLQAVSTIYGFDICPNNVAETQARLYSYILYGKELLLPPFLTGKDRHTLNYIESVTPTNELSIADDYEERLYIFAAKEAAEEGRGARPKEVKELWRKALKLVLQKNFQQGDFLAQKNAAGEDLLVGSWAFPTLPGKGTQIRREDFKLADVGKDDAKPVRVMKLQSLSSFVAGGGNA